jgi:hypothetical protein
LRKERKRKVEGKGEKKRNMAKERGKKRMGRSQDWS